MKTPEKLRLVAIQLHALKVAEGLTGIATTLTHHWRDAQDEPHSAPCSVKVEKDELTITMTIDRNSQTIYQGPINWLYGITRYDEDDE